jgi:hypothetical protein
MKKEDLDNWIKSAKYIESIESYTDSYGNYDVCKIFEKDGKLFMLSFSNQYPDKKWIDGKGYTKDDYAEPEEVLKKTRIVEETYYETPDEYQYTTHTSVLQPE